MKKTLKDGRITMTIAKSFKRTWMRKRITSKTCADPQQNFS